MSRAAGAGAIAYQSATGAFAIALNATRAACASSPSAIAADVSNAHCWRVACPYDGAGMNGVLAAFEVGSGDGDIGLALGVTCLYWVALRVAGLVALRFVSHLRR